MQVQFKASELFTVVAEGNTHTELYNNLASLAEVFSIPRCGHCNSNNIIPIRRVVENNSHYEIQCKECRARLTLGKNKAGETLYPRRKYHDKHPDVKAGQAAEGDWLPNGGWEVWSGEAVPAAKAGRKR